MLLCFHLYFQKKKKLWESSREETRQKAAKIAWESHQQHQDNGEALRQAPCT